MNYIFLLVVFKKSFIFRCENGIYKLTPNNVTSIQMLTLQSNKKLTFIQKLEDPFFVTMAASFIFMLVIIVILLVIVCKMKKRPRIKKRIIVNKNVTPLTYRPQPTSEQCEITIENCCNMNVCETVSIIFFFYNL